MLPLYTVLDAGAVMVTANGVTVKLPDGIAEVKPVETADKLDAAYG